MRYAMMDTKDERGNNVVWQVKSNWTADQPNVVKYIDVVDGIYNYAGKQVMVKVDGDYSSVDGKMIPTQRIAYAMAAGQMSEVANG